MELFALVALASNLVILLLISSSTTENRQGRFGPRFLADKTTSKPTRYSKLKECLPTSVLSIPIVWTTSHVLTSLILLSTSLTHSPTTSTILVSLLGISWALTQWAPLALISAEVANQQETVSRARSESRALFSLPQADDSAILLQVLNNTYDVSGYSADEEKSPNAEQEREAGNEEEELAIAGGLQAGAVMGLYNVSIAAPQIVAAAGSSGLFWVMAHWDLKEVEVVGWVIRLAGLSGLIAAWTAAAI